MTMISFLSWSPFLTSGKEAWGRLLLPFLPPFRGQDRKGATAEGRNEKAGRSGKESGRENNPSLKASDLSEKNFPGGGPHCGLAAVRPSLTGRAAPGIP